VELLDVDMLAGDERGKVDPRNRLPNDLVLAVVLPRCGPDKLLRSWPVDLDRVVEQATADQL
jgi:hypothetical protein